MNKPSEYFRYYLREYQPPNIQENTIVVARLVTIRSNTHYFEGCFVVAVLDVVIIVVSVLSFGAVNLAFKFI